MICKCSICGETRECRWFIPDGWYTDKHLCADCMPKTKDEATALRKSMGIGFTYTAEDHKSYMEFLERNSRDGK